MRVSDLTVEYGSRKIYDNFSIDFEDESITMILGPSGCGKTTLLNAISNRCKEPGQLSYVFQEPRFIPWCTISKNIALTLNGNSGQRRDVAREYLVKVGLEKQAACYPDKLSGGELQRASIARAFAHRSKILLMDEPFQSQDPVVKMQLIDLVRQLQSEEKRTIIAVTHNAMEAASLADRAVILNGSPVSIILEVAITSGFEQKITEVLSQQKAFW